MSAAAPLSPPPGGRMGNGTSDTVSYGPRGIETPGSKGGQPSASLLPHIRDLQTRAELALERKGDPYSPIGNLLDYAQECRQQATALLDFRRPDLAFVEYLVLSEIVVNRIPRHKSFPDLQGDRGRLHQLNRDLRNFIKSQSDRFENIRDIIENDNKRSGVQPKIGRRDSSRVRQSRQETFFDRQQPRISNNNGVSILQNGSPYQRQDELMLPPSNPAASQSSSSATPSISSEQIKKRPPVQPKPKTLHGSSFSINGVSPDGLPRRVDPLTERFSRLRASTGKLSTTLDTAIPDNAVEVLDSPMKMPSPTEYQRHGAPPGARPHGPRDMPSVLAGPPHPPKLPLNTKIAASMPKEPSPIYSPARNMSTPASIDPPRSSARSIVGTGGNHNNMAASSVSSQAPSINGSTDEYFPKVSMESAERPPTRRKSVHLPKETQIDPSRLHDYLRMYSVLIIDVRSREDFDQGHIMGTAVMCIEPTALRANMSAEELQDSLVLSPDSEQDMFDRRDQFDLVVYCDQSTRNTDFLRRRDLLGFEVSLRNLHNALYEFNQEKPLQRPPILLAGGIDAWADVLGAFSLVTSNTAAISALQGGKAPYSRRKPISGRRESRTSMIKKRREYNPLDQEEAQKWLERALNERPATEQPLPVSEDIDQDQDDSIVTINRTIDDVFRRFPDPSEIEQQSMMYAPKRLAPQVTPLVPYLPPIPSKPPPTVPRMSYSGVHERDSTAPVNNNRSAQLPAYVPPVHHPQYRLPKTGLVNFGVTCYMNATIQCLNATIPMSMLFVQNGYVNYVQRDNWKGSNGLMSENYATLIKNLWANDVTAVRPTSLRKLCARFNSEWGQDRQQDAKEFLEFLLDILHEDLNPYWSRPPLKALTDAEETEREKLPTAYASYVEWGRYSHREKSRISELFAGQHASRLRCMKCHKTSTTYEAFYSISVEIPQDRPADIRDCLRSYCSQERLSGDEVWKCPHCKREREATKQITVTRAPKFLVLHLKRFSASHTESARKVRTPIDFPLTGLDLGPFMLPPPTTEEEVLIARRLGGPGVIKDMRSDQATNGPYIYNAFAVTRHLGGTIASGHYIAMVKDPSRPVWREFNDSQIRDFDPEALRGSDRLQNEQAYIVYYERVRK